MYLLQIQRNKLGQVLTVWSYGHTQSTHLNWVDEEVNKMRLWKTSRNEHLVMSRICMGWTNNGMHIRYIYKAKCCLFKTLCSYGHQLAHHCWNHTTNFVTEPRTYAIVASRMWGLVGQILGGFPSIGCLSCLEGRVLFHLEWYFT
jgi:hypothetical protein